MRHEIDSGKHHNNLLKTVEGTAWILCDALHTMAENNIIPDGGEKKCKDTLLAQYISEIYGIIAECEEPEVIDHTADKMLEYAGNHRDKLIQYIQKYMGDNPLTERILKNNPSH